jgi:hypothetical protein
VTRRINAGLRARCKGGALLVGFVGCALAAAQAATAQQDPGQVTIDASRCLELKSPEARLACYELQVGAALGTEKKATGGESPQGASQAAPKAEGSAAAKAVEGERAAKAAQPATSAHSAPASAASPAQPNRADESPARESRAERHARSRAAEDEREQDEIVGTVAALREREPNQLVITLEDGQVWQQTAPERYELRVGSQVRLRSSRWGSMYRLTDDQLRGFILVKRIQ